MAKRGKPKVGDVFEVTLRNSSLAYLQKVSEEPLGDLVRVLPGRYDAPSQDIAALAAGPHEYLMFAILSILVREGHARPVGTWSVPEGVWSGLMLSPRYDSWGRLNAWVVTDGRTAKQTLESLPASLRRQLPIWQLGDSLHVVDMLAASSTGGLEAGELETWRENAGLTDEREVSESEDAGEGPSVHHFVRFPDGADLGDVITDLEKHGFSCSVVTDPDLDGQVVVIKANPSAPAFIDDQSDRVLRIVSSAGGEYDGWEAATGSP